MKKRPLISIPVLLSVIFALLIIFPAVTHAAPTNGWYNDGWDWFYYKDGAKQTGWLYDNGSWYYLKPEMVSKKQITINGKEYYFYKSGAMGTGWIEADMGGWSAWLYADSSGALQKDWQKVSGKWYYLDPTTYQMYSDLVTEIGGKDYYFYPSGAMATGWIKQVIYDGTYWYYADSSGALQKGWQKIGGKWYYLDTELYYMYCDGPCEIDGKKYLLDKSGAWVSSPGWYKFDEYWFYITSKGTYVTGWQEISGKWYYFDQGGIMMTAGYVIDDHLHFFDNSGAWIGARSAPGWHKDQDGIWFYVLPDGTACSDGSLIVDGKSYYFHTGGYMAYDECVDIGGILYYYTSSGALATKEGWYQDFAYDWYYVRSDGRCHTGWRIEGDKKYYLDPDFGYMYADGYYWIDGHQYQFDKSGALMAKG